MKSKIYLIIFVIFAVYVGYRLYRRPASPAQVEAIEEKTAAPTAPDQDIPGMTDTPAAAPTPAPTPWVTPKTTATPAESPVGDETPINETMTPMEAQARVQQIFTDDNLKEIEGDWEHLDMQAEAVATDKGWRLHILSQDTHFAKAGFHDGDFITKDTLLQAFDGSPDMVDRAMSVLNRISQ